ncbi:polysaccharide deacetylase family protein [Micromonospora okii]|uniref:polysaccharide deacetylase family protein n=1 Tax=Micromonospora okii TaxID=1182970 RepID=UPI001E557D94|nr:polysaccharide deacetylase family protein [Micromonospora okii]
MRTDSTGRFVGLAALAVVALLASAYALGQSMVPEPSRQSTGLPTDAHYADQPPEAAPTPDASPTPPASGGPSAGPTETGQDGDAGRNGGPGQAGDPGRNGDDGQPPEATPGDGLYGAQVTTGSPEVALTFDDGPDPRYTPQVLDVLREHHVRATFCVVGKRAQDYPDLIRAIAADGHTLCNHSWDHDELLGRRSVDVIRADLLRANAAIRAAVPDARIPYFRQPGGAWTYPVVSVADDLGLVPLHWDVDPSDWRAPGAARIATVVSTYVRPGSIVLLHDAGGNRQGTVDALYRLLPDLTGRFELEALPTGTA